jgi:hypothetical protein
VCLEEVLFARGEEPSKFLVYWEVSVQVHADEGHSWYVPRTYKIRASLSLSKMNASIWMPKITNDEIRAVTKATKLMPCDPWAEPTLLVAEGVEALVVADMVEVVVVPVRGFRYRDMELCGEACSNRG